MISDFNNYSSSFSGPEAPDSEPLSSSPDAPDSSGPLAPLPLASGPVPGLSASGSESSTFGFFFSADCNRCLYF